MLRKIMKCVKLMLIFSGISLGIYLLIDVAIESPDSWVYAWVFFIFGSRWNQHTRKD